MRTNHVHTLGCFIISPDILENIASKGTQQQRDLAYQALTASAQLRGQREALMRFSAFAPAAVGTKRRTIFDAQNGLSLPGKLVRGEKDKKSKDAAVNEAYDGSGKTYDFYLKVFNRNSIDGQGMRLDSTVHYRRNFNNAFWHRLGRMLTSQEVWPNRLALARISAQFAKDFDTTEY